MLLAAALNIHVLRSRLLDDLDTLFPFLGQRDRGSAAVLGLQYKDRWLLFLLAEIQAKRKSNGS